MTEEELAEYYDTHSFAEDFIEAKKNGDLIYCRPGENVIEAAKRHLAEKTQRTTAKAAMSRCSAVAAAVL